MKKVINGKRYDTETAKKIGEGSASCYKGDAEYFEEELYQKKTGEFFLHGRGGGFSRYGEYAYGAYTSGERIIPIAIDEAKTWVERFLSADEYEQIFEVEEEGNYCITVLVPENLKERIDQERDKTGKRLKDIVIESLNLYFEQ